MPVLGLLNPRSPDAMADRLRAFRLGLKDVGYVEGENVTIIYRFAEDQNDRLPELAAELVRRQVTVIAASATTAAMRAAQATDPLIKSAYERMAEHWMLLARLDSLLHNEKNNEDP